MFNFFEVEPARYKNLGLAYQAIRLGGNAPCVLNAANEVAVQAFLERRIGFTDMTAVLENTLERAQIVDSPTLDDLRLSDTEARIVAAEAVKKQS